MDSCNYEEEYLILKCYQRARWVYIQSHLVSTKYWKYQDKLVKVN